MSRTTSVIDPDEPAYEGQRHYTPAFLAVYDTVVLRLFCRVIWRCPARLMVDRYEQHVGRRHLDVGPGTGTLLRWASLPDDVEVTLLDPNPNVLAHAARRLSERRPTTVEADVLKPLPDIGPFDSIGLNGVLHCLPSPMVDRAPAIRHLADVLAPDGVLFGATLLGTPDVHTWVSLRALRSNVRKGFFDNEHDSEADLRTILEASFGDVAIDVAGSMARFTARRPRARPS